MKRYLIDCLGIVILPIRLHYEIVCAQFLQRIVLRTHNFTLAQRFEQLSTLIDQKISDFKNQTKVQMGCETFYQLLMSTILVCYAYSNTRSKQGLVSLFDENDLSFFGLALSSKIIVSFLLAVNFVSFVKIHFGGTEYVGQYSIMGKFMILLYISSSCAARIMSIILYFSPVLGLFDLLHHFQAEMLGYQALDPSAGEINYFNSFTKHVYPLVNTTFFDVQRGQYKTWAIDVSDYPPSTYHPPSIETYTRWSL